jgi:hypothetical protein
MLSCKEVTRIVASGELAEAGWGRRSSVRLHHLMCRHCRRYACQMRDLGTAARSLWGPGRDENPEALERLEGAILRRHPTQAPDP